MPSPNVQPRDMNATNSTTLQNYPKKKKKTGENYKKKNK